MEEHSMVHIIRQPLAEGKGEAVRFRLKEAGEQICEPTCLRADAQAGGQKGNIRLSLRTS